jgi:hypothetical protein
MAFKKSILSFENNVLSVERAIVSLLQNDLDMSR